ncbi:hypothetical protein B0J12DRAFT_200268 [Macrophomina phaseolina]|uniref:Uncharacterized protein n=1 Tax=Macrophomina phaseolina TaxID=35725 RepID=A0ABQ8G3F0_9PEZI|nr:hypothetical protein B0J12DRAFT_200268 [Macrophomina phaseolina]
MEAEKGGDRQELLLLYSTRLVFITVGIPFIPCMRTYLTTFVLFPAIFYTCQIYLNKALYPWAGARMLDGKRMSLLPKHFGRSYRRPTEIPNCFPGRRNSSI